MLFGHFLQVGVVKVRVKHGGMPDTGDTPDAMSVSQQFWQKSLQIERPVKLNSLDLPVMAILKSVSRHPFFQTFELEDFLNNELIITGFDKEDW